MNSTKIQQRCRQSNSQTLSCRGQKCSHKTPAQQSGTLSGTHCQPAPQKCSSPKASGNHSRTTERNRGWRKKRPNKYRSDTRSKSKGGIEKTEMRITRRKENGRLCVCVWMCLCVFTGRFLAESRCTSNKAEDSPSLACPLSALMLLKT